MPLLVMVLLVAILAMVAFGMRLLKVTKHTAAAEEEPDSEPEALLPLEEEDEFSIPDFPDFDEGGEAPDPDDEGQKLLDLFDYFSDEEESQEQPEEQPAAPADPAAQGDVEERMFDRLCNLPMGRGFLADCQAQLNLAKENGQAWALAYFDFDRFRFINTLKGYSIGDYVLQKMVQDMVEIFPEAAMISRLSADHFVAMFPYADEQQVLEYIEQLRRCTDRIRGDIGAKSSMRVTTGLAVTKTSDSYDIYTLIHKANIARHCMKITRNEQYVEFDQSMLDSYLFGESALDDYNENQYCDEMEIYFQPLSSVQSGRIVNSEALARWIYEENNTEQPPSVENGRLPTNNLKVIYNAFKSMSRWRKAGQELVPVMVNLHVLDLYKEDIDAFFARCLNEFQIEPKMATAVINVNAIRLQPDKAAAQIQKLVAVGVNIAVSDIDRGLQTLPALDGLPVKYIKLYKGFVHDIATREDQQALVRRVVQYAQQQGIECVFEGVDYSSVATILKDHGATLVQGAFSGLPRKPEDFARDLQEHFLYRRGHGNTTIVLDDEMVARGELRL